MSSDACFPSMKVRGIALGVRISYLRDTFRLVCAEAGVKRARMKAQVVPVGVQFLETLSPLSELLEGDAVREALSADADALQDPVAPQLVQN